MAEGQASEKLRNQPLFTLAKEIYKIGDQHIEDTHADCDRGVAWLLEHDRGVGEASQRYVRALFDTMTGQNSGYFLVSAFAVLDPEAAGLWRITPTRSGDHYLPPRGHRILR